MYTRHISHNHIFKIWHCDDWTHARAHTHSHTNTCIKICTSLSPVCAHVYSNTNNNNKISTRTTARSARATNGVCFGTTTGARRDRDGEKTPPRSQNAPVETFSIIVRVVTTTTRSQWARASPQRAYITGARSLFTLYVNDPQPGVVREQYPRTAMCVRNVDVHVSCSSQVDAQLAAFFIDPRAK